MLNDILEKVSKEIEDTAHWPCYNSAHEALAVLQEEFEELKREVHTNQMLRSLEDMRKECIQVAAVAVKFAAALDIKDWIRK